MPTVEYWQTEQDHQHEDVMHRLEMQGALGQGALKSMMLANGGAIISLLTFIGNKAALVDASSVRISMVLFGAGLFAGLFSYFGAYFSQADFMMVSTYRRDHAHEMTAGRPGVVTPPVHAKRGNICLWISICMLLLSLVLFGLGSAFALNGII